MVPTLPIRELANLLHGRLNPWKAMALLRVYLDESGTHADAKIAAIGGLMATKDSWGSIEDQWVAAIDVFADVGLTCYRSTDCDGGRGEFEQIPIELRFALANRLARIIAAHKVLPVWSAVITEDWHRVVKDADFLKAFPKPLHLCFWNCARRLAEGSANLAEGSSVAVVYAEQKEFQEEFADIWSAYKRSKEFARLNSFTTASPKDCPALQAADLVSYEMYREWLEREYGTPPPPLTLKMRKPLYYLHEGGLRKDFGGCYDAHALEVAIARFKETGDV